MNHNCTIFVQERQELIARFKKGRLDRKGTVGLLLSSDMDFTPFDMTEVAFDVIGPHCLDNGPTVGLGTLQSVVHL